jgi:hypothetical protein
VTASALELKVAAHGLRLDRIERVILPQVRDHEAAIAIAEQIDLPSDLGFFSLSASIRLTIELRRRGWSPRRIARVMGIGERAVHRRCQGKWRT